MEMIKSRAMRTGDGSHSYSRNRSKNDDSGENEEVRDENHFWGFGDKEMTNEDMKKITIIRKLHG